jgi:hypothetical protein
VKIFMAKSFREASKSILARYGGNIAVLICGFGNYLQMTAGGFGTDWYQMTAGEINLGSTASGVTLSHTRLGLIPPLALAGVAMTIQQWPLLASGDPGTWFAHGFMLLSYSPAFAEPWAKERAAARLANFKMTGQTLLQRTWGRTKRLALKVFAKPRLAFGILFAMSLLPMAVNEIAHGRLHLLPVYGTWLSGVTVMAFSESINETTKHGGPGTHIRGTLAKQPSPQTVLPR